MSKFVMKLINLSLFSANTNVTTDSGLTSEMKTFYSDYLIDLAEPELVHNQFGQKHPIPKNGGKQIEFRKYASLPKALTPLTEGVTPDGQKLTMSTITATVSQYGGYVELSDILLMTAIDNNQVEAVKLLASQAGRTLDTITRDIITAGTSVIYSGNKLSRGALVGGDATPANNCYLTVDDVRKAVRYLKVNNAKKINGYYVGIIHPDAAYDLMSDTKWVNVKTYSDPDGIYEGEIGKIEGVRFVESSEAKVFYGENLGGTNRALKINNGAGYSGAITTVAFDGASSTIAADALIGRYININGVAAKITDNTSSALTFASTNFGSIADNADIYPGEGGKAGRAVYGTLIIAADAYGVTEITGGGLQYISKQLGSSGTADPLNQRATCGWKATAVAERLVENYMVRIESASTFETEGN